MVSWVVELPYLKVGYLGYKISGPFQAKGSFRPNWANSGIMRSLNQPVNAAKLQMFSVINVKPGYIPTVSDVKCPECSREFRGIQAGSHYRRHYRDVHLKIKDFQCGCCGRLFAQDSTRKSHQARCFER